MLAYAEPSSEPIATPSICWCMLLLKLNSTEEVASCFNSTKMLREKLPIITAMSFTSLYATGIVGTLIAYLNV